jgi:hypothetical protein
MIRVAGGFDFKGLYVYPREVGGTAPEVSGTETPAFNYLPVQPRPETDAQGRPTLSFILAGQTGFLQLGARLTAPEDALQALREELAVRLKLDDSAQVILELAPLQVQAAMLSAGDGAGNYQELYRSQTSGFPPYTALFHVQTNAAQQAAVTAALNGREGFLRVSYAATISRPVQARARICGDARDLLAELSKASRGDDLSGLARSLMESALEHGALTLELESSEGAPPDLSAKVSEQAKDHLVEMLVQVRRGVLTLPDQAGVKAEAAQAELIDQALELVSDVASWLGGKGAEHIILPPGETGRVG